MHKEMRIQNPKPATPGGSRITPGDEKGFTLIELALTLTILGILLTVGVLSYAGIARSANMTAAKKQVEIALERAKTAARQENVTYQLIFYSSADTYPNSYEFKRNEYDPGTNIWSPLPVNGSVSGETVQTAGGDFYIKFTNGVNVVNRVTITFSPEGTTMSVTAMTINLIKGSTTGSVSIDASGKITTI